VWTSCLEASWCSNGAAEGRSPDPRLPAPMRHSPREKERFCAVDLVQLCGLLGYRIPPCIAGVGGGSDFFWVGGWHQFFY
jgi:hypothetical protein